MKSAFIKISIFTLVLFFCLRSAAQHDTVTEGDEFINFIGKHPQDPEKPEFFIRSRNNDYQLGLGGCLQVDALIDLVPLDYLGAFVTESIPVAGRNRVKPHLHMDIYKTILNADILGNTPLGKMKIYIDLEVNNILGNVSIRNAFGFIKGFLIGKTSSTIMDLDAVPHTFDIDGPNSMMLGRRVMLRYTFFTGKSLTFNFAAELSQKSASYSEYTEPAFQYIPDAIVKVRFRNKRGHLSLGGIYRYFVYDDTLNSLTRGANGWGVSLAGEYVLFPKIKVLFQGNYGNGIASYIHDFISTKRDFVPSTNSLGRMSPIPVYGGYTSLEIKWCKNAQSTFIYSYLSAGDLGNKPMDSYQHGNYILGNFIWFFLKNFQVGAEFVCGNRVNKSGEKGNALRFYLFSRFDF